MCVTERVQTRVDARFLIWPSEIPADFDSATALEPGSRDRVIF